MAGLVSVADAMAYHDAAWQCYKAFRNTGHDPIDEQYLEFRESVEELYLSTQKLQLEVLSDLAHDTMANTIGNVDDDFSWLHGTVDTVRELLPISTSRSPSYASPSFSAQVEDPGHWMVPFEPIDDDHENGRGNYGYMDPHAIRHHFTVSNVSNVSVCSSCGSYDSDRDEGGTALWRASTTTTDTAHDPLRARAHTQTRTRTQDASCIHQICDDCDDHDYGGIDHDLR